MACARGRLHSTPEQRRNRRHPGSQTTNHFINLIAGRMIRTLDKTEETNMKSLLTTSLTALAAIAGIGGLAQTASAQDLVFLSTQLRPIEEAQKVRDVLLKGGAQDDLCRRRARALHRPHEGRDGKPASAPSASSARSTASSSRSCRWARSIRIDDVVRQACRPQASPPASWSSARSAPASRCTSPGCRRPT